MRLSPKKVAKAKGINLYPEGLKENSSDLEAIERAQPEIEGA